MSGYSDYYKDVRQAEFLERWIPKTEVEEKNYSEQERWFLARARAAEDKIKQYESVTSMIRGVLKNEPFMIGH